MIARLCSLVMCLLLLQARPMWAQALFPPLQTQEFVNPELMRNIYLGRFERIPALDPSKAALITDDGFAARKAFLAYVVAFSDQCQASLGPNKREVKEVIISYSERQELWMTRFGPMFGAKTREELSRETRSTGVFADPEFYEAYIAIVNASSFDALVTLVRDIMAKRSDNLSGAGLSLVQNVLRMSMDARGLLARHGCESVQARYYGKNLLRYVRGQSQPVHREQTFLVKCQGQLATLIPGAQPQHCACLQDLFRRRLDKQRFWELEDDFTEQRFLGSAVAKVGLHREVAACLR